MPIQVTCRACGREYQIKEKFAGQTLPCKECGARFRVPAAPAEDIVDFEDDFAPQPRRERRRPPSPTEQPKRRRPPEPERARSPQQKRPRRKQEVTAELTAEDDRFRYIAVGVIILMILTSFGWWAWTMKRQASAKEQPVAADSWPAPANREVATHDETVDEHEADLDSGPHAEPSQPPPGPQFTHDRGPLPPPGFPVVVFEMTGFQGPGNSWAAANQALISIRWVHRPFVRVEESQRRIIVGVRGASVNTGDAKTALERLGFGIGGVQYRPGGL